VLIVAVGAGLAAAARTAIPERPQAD
jgi:hypothetical protein